MFTKYRTRGAYHFEQIGLNIFKANSFVKQRYINCIKLLKKNKNNGKILDLGCGDGALTYMLFKEGYNAEGIDISA
jgi:2-polyprenyl-3-methyl-5-hydroxy-6-metoxy-1,4-benzoquinol methylase